MAHMNQEKKRVIKTAIDAVLKEKGLTKKVKYSLSVRHHTGIVCKIKSSTIDFLKNHNDLCVEQNKTLEPHRQRRLADGNVEVNPYYLDAAFTGEALDVIKAMWQALNTNNFDNSDPMADYHHVGFYADIKIGSWDKPFSVIK